MMILKTDFHECTAKSIIIYSHSSFTENWRLFTNEILLTGIEYELIYNI